MISVESLSKTLGGPTALKRRITTLADFHRLIAGGLPFAALEMVMRRFQLNRGEVETLLQIPARTIARRKHSRRLRHDESDRLMRLARIATQPLKSLEPKIRPRYGYTGRIGRSDLLPHSASLVRISAPSR
ncbi:MAG: hypothetical protein M5R38_18880 [Candidatus Methylomirabilis sp.]|nr:hypothetical protein [Candidatus Methylomirabilis sp.]